LSPEFAALNRKVGENILRALHQSLNVEDRVAADDFLGAHGAGGCSPKWGEEVPCKGTQATEVLNAARRSCSDSEVRHSLRHVLCGIYGIKGRGMARPRTVQAFTRTGRSKKAGRCPPVPSSA